MDETLASNVSGCLDDLIYFFVDPWRAFETVNGFTPQILPALIDHFWIYFIHCCFDEIYCISNAEVFLAVHDLEASFGINDYSNISNTWRVYEALTRLMIPW